MARARSVRFLEAPVVGQSPSEDLARFAKNDGAAHIACVGVVELYKGGHQRDLRQTFDGERLLRHQLSVPRLPGRLGDQLPPAQLCSAVLTGGRASLWM